MDNATSLLLSVGLRSLVLPREIASKLDLVHQQNQLNGHKLTLLALSAMHYAVHEEAMGFHDFPAKAPDRPAKKSEDGLREWSRNQAKALKK